MWGCDREVIYVPARAAAGPDLEADRGLYVVTQGWQPLVAYHPADFGSVNAVVADLVERIGRGESIGPWTGDLAVWREARLLAVLYEESDASGTHLRAALLRDG
jgi:hypothetical protein